MFLLYSQGEKHCSKLADFQNLRSVKKKSDSNIAWAGGMDYMHLDICYGGIIKITHFDQYKYLY